MMRNKILLFGKRGQLGKELCKILTTTSTELFAYSSQEINVSNTRQLQYLIQEIKPQLIINASAYTNVDRAEEEVELAKSVNATAPSVMAECAKKISAGFIHFSTDYVFDGKNNVPYTEDQTPNPLNVYGKSKLEGEQAISQIGGAFFIFRTSWVYSLYSDNFVTKVLLWARQKETLQIVTDQIGSPTWAQALAQVIGDLIKKYTPNIKNDSGIYHLGGKGSVSRYDFAKEILRLDPKGGHVTKILKPALTLNFPTPAVRPLNTALNCSKFEQVFNLQLPNWNESLKFAFGNQ